MAFLSSLPFWFPYFDDKNYWCKYIFASTHYITEKYEKKRFDPLETPSSKPFRFKNHTIHMPRIHFDPLKRIQKDALIQFWKFLYSGNMDRKYISVVLKWSNHYFSQRSYADQNFCNNISIFILAWFRSLFTASHDENFLWKPFRWFLTHLLNQDQSSLRKNINRHNDHPKKCLEWVIK